MSEARRVCHGLQDAKGVRLAEKHSGDRCIRFGQRTLKGRQVGRPVGQRGKHIELQPATLEVGFRRIAEVARLMVDAGLIVIVSFISPFRAERRMARQLFESDEFVEVFVDTPIEECERRDPKGLYAKARRGELRNFTGIDSPYEPPEAAEVRVDTRHLSPADAAEAILRRLEQD